jgi:uncharacterized protein (DUF952 family)
LLETAVTDRVMVYDGNVAAFQSAHPVAIWNIADGSRPLVEAVYKICTAAEWRLAEQAGIYRGSEVDQRDGFIHFSTGAQVADTAARHFAKQNDLVLLTVDAAALGDRLKWEPSRGGALFPHLYGELSLKAVRRFDPLPVDADGRHKFPPLAD